MLATSQVCIPLGYFPISEANGYIPAVLKTLQLSAERFKADEGHDLYRLIGRSPTLEVEVKVDPRKSYAIKELIWTRPKQAISPGHIGQFRYEVDSWETIADAAFPISFHTMAFRPGGRVTPKAPPMSAVPSKPRTLVPRTVTNVFHFGVVRPIGADEVNTALCLDVPDGIEGYSIDSPHLRYIWKDGVPQPAMPSNAAMSTRQAAFKKAERRLWANWLIILNAIVIAGVIGLYIVQRARRKGKT